jgi:hypothetical protein
MVTWRFLSEQALLELGTEHGPLTARRRRVVGDAG